MKRPILIVVLGYVIGIIIGLYCKISIAFFYPVIILIGCIIKKYIEKNRNVKRYYCLFVQKNIIIMIVIVSIFSNTIVLLLNNSYENKYQKIEKSNFVATIVSDEKIRKYDSQYKIKVEMVKNDKTYNNTYLLLNLNEESNLEYGDKISFAGEYTKPEIQRNYKGFSYATYLKSIGIYGTVEANSVEKIGEGNVNVISKIAKNIRQRMKQTIANNIKDKNKKNLLLGILLGYDDELSSSIKEDFSDSGLSHILAVSGMHISYILLGISYLFKKLKSPKKLTSIITCFILILFIFLTGEMPSVKRACIMAILSIGASVLYKKSDTITNLSVALLIILIQNPFSIMNTGLILSFLATIGIIYLYPMIYSNNIKEENEKEKSLKKAKNKLPSKIEMLEKIYKKGKEIICISVSAQVFIFPISILLFNKITLTFLFANLLVSLFISTILILGFISTIIQIPLLYRTLEILLDFLLFISNFFAKLPISKIIITTPHILLIILYYVALIFFVSIKKLRKKPIKRRIEKQILTFVDKFKYEILKRVRIIICIIMLLILIFQIIKTLNPKLTIHFIDVGQGDSTLVITPNHKTLLVDGGGNKDLETFDVGKQTLLPYILDRNIKQIDYLMISHFDTDHCNGTIAVLENIKVKTLLISKQAEICNEYEKIIEVVKRKNIEVKVIKAGDIINIGGNIELEILYPEEKLKYTDLNNNSIVTKLKYNNFSMLFVGDIEKEAEQELIKMYKENTLKSTVLKIAHHGSKTSSTQAFLETVNPKVALIGVGKDNMFGHPNEEVLERLEKLSIKQFRTDLNGEITIIVTKNGIKINKKID